MVECGILRATSLEPAKSLSAGEVGYITASIKNVREARVNEWIAAVQEKYLDEHPDMMQFMDEILYKMQKKITALAPRDGSVNPEQVMRKLLGAGGDL